MAVSKPVPADSSNDLRKVADQPPGPTTGPAAEWTPGEGHTLLGFHDLQAAIPGWNLHLLRTGAALLAGFEILYFVADHFLSPLPTPADTALHAAAIGLTLSVFALAYSRWFERHWRLVCLANLVALYALTLKLRLLTGDTGPLALTLILTLIGSGALLEWSARWQAGLSAIALATAVMPQLMHGPFGRVSAYRYFGVALGIALGHFILATRERYRAELAEWLDRLRTSHRELAQALAESAATMAGRERAERELSAAREALAVELRELELNRRRLAASEDKLRKVLEATGDAITVNRLTDGQYLDVNQAFSDVTGYTREEALGRGPMELGLWHDAEQLDRLLRLLKTEGRLRNLECTFRRKDGSLVDHLVSASLIRLDGETCIVWATRDVSEIKRTERELRAMREALSTEVRGLEASQARLRDEIGARETAQRQVRENEESLRRIFEASLDAITIKRQSDGRYVDVNNAFEVFGYTREEAREKTAEELGIWAYPRQLAAFTEKIRQAGRISNFETLCRTRSGTTIPSLVSAVTVEMGGEPCVVSFVRDISALKQTERELIAAREAALAGSEAKSQFLSVMSHEIRTPMNAILGMADLLWETPLTGEQHLYLETMRNNSASLLNLIDGILDLSKVESGRLSLECNDFDLAELAEGATETMAPQAHEKGLELALRIPCALPTAVVGDSLRLRQILINLLGNAIKFTERGEVTLTIEAADDAPTDAEGAAAPPGPAATVRRERLRFVVCDTGIGIPADRQEAIFLNFTQADFKIRHRYGGSGLGLAIVKRLVELMNGSVAVQSEPGAGSAFSFTIPLALQPGQPAKASTIPAYMARLAGKRLLLVDHSSTSRAIISELLARTGAEVEVADDGGAAIALVERARSEGRPYDAIVADHRTLEDGEAALVRHVLGAGSAPGEALVLMLAANKLNSQFERLRDRGLEQGPHCRYLLKPVRRAQLWATLAAACGVVADGRAYGNGADAATGYSAPRDTVIQQLSPRRADFVIDKPLSILMAEDSADSRLVVQSYLKDTPYLLDHAENGEVAVQKFAAGNYDAVLMDMQMPVMDGYDAVAAIRRLEQEDHRRRPTPIIALTAFAHEEAARRSLKMGCDAHVTKPVKRSTLLKAIRDTVEPAAQEASSPALAAGKGADDAPAACAERIVVQIDENLRDLVPGFLTRKREDARAVLAAAERRDAQAIARLGHKMKGEGGSYGLDAVTDIGRGLEQAGQEPDFEEAARLAGELANFLERLEIVY
ncbi:MAG TPA: PAS domain S-box protein, partial [Candidatus Binataceae bacterium]